jgi:hypothetical protein
MARCAFALALGLVLAAVGLAQKPNAVAAAAQKDIVDLAQTLRDGKTQLVAEKVTAIKARHTLDNLMTVFKIREKGGLGFEMKVIALQRSERGPSAVLKKESADLIKLAHVTSAMAAITRAYPPGGGKAGDKKRWNGALDEQKKASDELIKAVNANDSKSVSRAARRLLNACTVCHSSYRKV